MAADTFQIKRGTTAAVNAYLPAVGEPVYDITLKQLKIGDGVTLGGVASANASTADKLTTARTISTTGAVTGSVSFDGSANVAIDTALAASPALTGVPTTTTAAVDTNTTQVASTAFVVAQAASATPIVDGTGTVGTSLRYARQDHIHPTDTSRAPLASPALTGTPTVPTAAVDTNTLQAASTAFVLGQVGTATPIIDGTGAAGTSLRYSRQDHVHPTDTSRAPIASPTLTGVPLSTTPAVGTNTTQIATAAMVQAEIANKRTWTSYTPTITVGGGSYTTASATGKYMVAFGICFFQAQLTVTTKGTGANPSLSLPFAGLSGGISVFPARESTVNGKTGVGVLSSGASAFALAAYDNTDLVTANGCVVNISGSYPIA